MAMFIDVCVPGKNEEEFISIAKKLGTGGLCFLYNKEQPYKSAYTVFTGILTEGKTRQGKNVFSTDISRKSVFSQVSFFVPADSRGIAKLDLPTARMLKEKNKTLVLPFSALLSARSRPDMLRPLFHNLKLIAGTGLSMAIASFAFSPHELRSSADLRSVVSCLGLNTMQSKGSTELLAHSLK